MAESSASLSEQQDEILALSAIFGGDFSKCEYDECNTIYEIKIKVNLIGKKVQLRAWLPVEEQVEEDEPEEEKSNTKEASAFKKISFRRSESKKHTCLTLSVSHLTPLRLEFSLPRDYPTCSKPMFTLSCLWLDGYHLSCLCQKLDELWESNVGQAVIFSWVDWLQYSSLEFLGATETISLKPFTWDRDDTRVRDSRGLSEFLEPKSCALKILEHDFRMEQQRFRKESHVCEICFEEREGILFHFLEECGHKYCAECLLDYCQMHVNEGTVKQLQCPDKECRSTLTPIILRELLSEEDFQRWERLLFLQTLDGMVDVLYCPRCNSVVLQDEDEKSKLAQCGDCFFSFCTECLMSWHSTQPCGSELEPNPKPTSKLKEKRRRTNRTNQVTSNELEEVTSRTLHWKQKNMTPTMQNYQFLMLQQRLGKFQRCPKCRIMVEKTEGCNMMHCSHCSQSFCWQCGWYKDVVKNLHIMSH